MPWAPAINDPVCDLVTARSAEPVIVFPVVVVVLLAELGSEVALLTEAVLLPLLPAELAAMCAVRSKPDEAALASGPVALQVTTSPAVDVAGVVTEQVHAAPLLLDAYVIPVGRLSTIRGDAACRGPALLTVMVYSPDPPATKEPECDLVTDRSAWVTVIRPILLVLASVNHIEPSGPAAIP